MAVYAPDCGKDSGIQEAFISSVTKVLREGRRGGAREFYITGDLNVELGFMCTDEEDIEELVRCAGPRVGKGTKTDHGAFKKLMSYGIMKEFNCKATSTWSKCGRDKETAFTHRQLGEKMQELKAQLDYIIGPRWKSDDACIHNDVKIWDSWDHCPIYAMIQEDEIAKYFPARKRKKWTGWRPKTDEQKN